MKIGYARVSTSDQAVDLQVDALKQAGCAKVYTEVISCVRTNRPVLDELLKNLRSGDVVVIWKLDRLVVAISKARERANNHNIIELRSQGGHPNPGSSLYPPN